MFACQRCPALLTVSLMSAGGDQSLWQDLMPYKITPLQTLSHQHLCSLKNEIQASISLKSNECAWATTPKSEKKKSVAQDQC